MTRDKTLSAILEDAPTRSKDVCHSPAGEDDVLPDWDVEKADGAIENPSPGNGDAISSLATSPTDSKGCSVGCRMSG